MQIDMDDGIATIKLDDGKANVLGHTLLDDINEVLDRLESEAQAIIITGREGMFSGGFDLEELRKGRREAAVLANRGARLFHRLFGYPMPLIGACSGHAVAAGSFTLLSCDTRIGADGPFKIGLNETAIGMLHLGWGHALISDRISRRHVTAAVIQAQLYNPKMAVDVGYLDDVVDPEHLLDRSMEIAQGLKKLPKATYAQMKLDVRKDVLAMIEKSIRDAEQ